MQIVTKPVAVIMHPMSESLHDEVASYLKREFGTDEFDRLKNKDAAEAKINSLLPLAVERLEYLLLNADKDSVVWGVAKYVIEHSLGKDGGEDEIKELLKGITKRPATT